VQIVRRMVDAGAALAVMGNHELNAIAWHTPDPRRPGQYLRSHDSPTWGAKNRKQHAAFLDEVESKPALHYEIVEWFLTLPLWLDLPALHVVHACWHPVFMAWLAPRLERGRYLTRELMIPATDEPEGTLAAAFWCMNGGLVLMVSASACCPSASRRQSPACGPGSGMHVRLNSSSNPGSSNCGGCALSATPCS